MGNSQTRISVPPKKSEKILTISISLAVVECGENKISHFLWSIRQKDDDLALSTKRIIGAPPPPSILQKISI